MIIFYFIGTSMENAEKENAEIIKQERIELKEQKKLEKEKIKEEKEVEKAAEKKEKEVQDAKKEGNKIKVDEQLLFGKFTVNMDQVRVYEEEGKTFADISFDWLNQAADGKKSFMQLSLLSVYQGESVIEDTEGAWDIENKSTSRIYFPNAENGEIGITLTYELENTDDPLLIKFQPLNSLIEENSQELTIEI